jgi:hypothetical protein
VLDVKRAALARAKARLDRLDLYPRPVSLRRARILVVPWLFRLPWFRRFDGYALHETILLRSAAHLEDADLVTHELCHVWQMQQHPLAMPLSYLYRGYQDNPNEVQARQATEATRPGQRFGLCDSCRFQRIVRTGRGSVFTLCERSRIDSSFPKYPRVPVLECRGYEPES